MKNTSNTSHVVGQQSAEKAALQRVIKILPALLEEAIIQVHDADYIPRPGSTTAAIWEYLDKQKASGAAPTLAEVRSEAVARNWNVHTAQVKFYSWREAHETPIGGRNGRKDQRVNNRRKVKKA